MRKTNTKPATVNQRSFTIKERLVGTPQRYFVGLIIDSQGNTVSAHTSKNLNYLYNLLSERC